MRRFLFALAFLLLGSSVVHAEIPWSGIIGDDRISLVYDPKDGSLWLDAASKELTALEIVSASKYFKGTKPSQVSGIFDVYVTDPANAKYGEKLFILKPGADRFGDQNFGPVLVPGLSISALAADLTVSGALYPSGPLGIVDILIPEPSSLLLLGIGLPSLVRRARRRWQFAR